VCVFFEVFFGVFFELFFAVLWFVSCEALRVAVAGWSLSVYIELCSASASIV
jgi:hypothetical protein